MIFDALRTWAEVDLSAIEYNFTAVRKHLPKTIFVKHISELRDLNPHNAVVTDYCLEKFLTADKILVLRQLQENKLMAVMDCVKKAVNREATEDNAHYITV